MGPKTLTVMPFLLAMFVAVAAMPTNVYQICAWGAGTLEVEAWRRQSAAVLRSATAGIRAWFAALWSPRIAFACVAVLLAIMVAQFGSAEGVLMAIAPAAAPLVEKRSLLLREADALKTADGTFENDEKRSAFDAKMTEVDTLDEQIRKAETAPAAPELDAVRTQAITEERARVSSIQTLVRKHKLEEKVADDLVKRGVTLDAARAEILDKLVTAQEGTTVRNQNIEMGEDAQDKFLRGASNWLLIKGGAADIVARSENPAAPNVKAIDPGEFRGLSLLDLARLSLEKSGVKVRSMNRMDLVAQALTARGTITQSTSDFATLLENTMHKMLQAAYSITPDTWRRFCAIGSVSDFRAHNRYRMGSFSSLDAINENGEFKSKAIADGEKASITATTKGNLINVSRQMIVNDDMGAFTSLLSRLGRAAGLSVEVDVYALLAQNSGDGPTMSDSVALFHTSSHGGNKTTGAALSAAAIDLDRVAMASQRDVNSNEYLDLRPAILVLPVGLGGAARVINTSQYDPDTVANKSQMKPNAVVGLFRDVVDTPRITGTRRYLFADPSIAPVIEVAFLEGQQAPVLETRDGWNVDGTEMKVRFDYGVAAVDYRGAVTNAGA